MELDFNKIVNLKSIRVEKSNLSEKEQVLSRPLMNDRGLIKEIYTKFVEVLNERCMPPIAGSVLQRKKFIFIILYLYSPSTLAGGKMLKGLRDDICNVLGLNSVSTISDNCSDVVFLYQNYPDFSNDINDVFKAVMERI